MIGRIHAQHHELGQNTVQNEFSAPPPVCLPHRRTLFGVVQFCTMWCNSCSSVCAVLHSSAQFWQFCAVQTPQNTGVLQCLNTVRTTKWCSNSSSQFEHLPAVRTPKTTTAVQLYLGDYGILRPSIARLAPLRLRRGWQTRKFLCDRQRRQSMENVWEQRMGSRPIANGGGLLEKWPAADGQLSRWRENKTALSCQRREQREPNSPHRHRKPACECEKSHQTPAHSARTTTQAK